MELGKGYVRVGRESTAGQAGVRVSNGTGKLGDQLINVEIFERKIPIEHWRREYDQIPQLVTTGTGGSMGPVTVDSTAAGYPESACGPNIESGLGCGGGSV